MNDKEKEYLEGELRCLLDGHTCECGCEFSLDNDATNRIDGKKIVEDYMKCYDSVLHLREYIEIMSDEPDCYIKASEVYHSIRRMIGDE